MNSTELQLKILNHAWPVQEPFTKWVWHLGHLRVRIRISFRFLLSLPIIFPFRRNHCANFQFASGLFRSFFLLLLMADIDQLRGSTLHRWNGLPSASLRPTRPWPEPYFTMAARSDSKQTRPRWRDQTSYYTGAHPFNSRLCRVAIEGRCGEGSLRVMQCKKV